MLLRLGRSGLCSIRVCTPVQSVITTTTSPDRFIKAMAVVSHSPSAFISAGVLTVQLKSRSQITGAYDSTLSKTGLTYHEGLGDSTHSE